MGKQKSAEGRGADTVSEALKQKDLYTGGRRKAVNKKQAHTITTAGPPPVLTMIKIQARTSHSAPSEQTSSCRDIINFGCTMGYLVVTKVR